MHRLARTKVGRRAAVGALLATLITLLALPLSAPAASTTSPVADDKGRIQPKLAAAFESSPGETQEFWVVLDSAADTSSAAAIKDWDKRGQAVHDTLRSHAKATQADVIARLKATNAKYTSYWITNAVHVEAGSYTLASSLAGVAGVETVRAPVAYQQVKPIEKELTKNKMGANAEASVEWGVANIKADQVWDTYGIRGDGIVVASIDTGVQYDHPALINSYRGHHADGTITHDYNWFDASGSSSAPVDADGHGTHTMGTMTGDDGAANRVGVAPGATWIAANGCCPSEEALIASAQWMLAPTKVDGTAPDPTKRPNVVNNSWGTKTPSTDPFIEDVLQAWADSGIFGVWANGNNGPGCNTSGAPGSRTMNYSVGNYDANDTIAPSSSRGSGQNGETKPNISAPGSNVRSAYPGNRYATMTGTSMAAPHTAAAVALLYSADPTLIGDLAATRAALDGTARDTADDQCGGTDADNNVYGEGRLDALALVESALDQTPSGSLTGSVTDAATGTAIPGASIRLTSGQIVRSTRQGESGSYALTVPAGEYTAQVTAYGYEPGTRTVTVVAGETETLDVALTPMPGGTVSGRVVDADTGAGIPEAVVTLAGSPHTATTDATGAFDIEHVVGPKTYLLSVNAGLCGGRLVTRSLDVEGTDLTVPTITMPRHHLGADYGTPYGYSCVTEPSAWTPGDTLLQQGPEDTGGSRTTKVDLPFPFRFHGRAFTSIGVYAPGANGPGGKGAGVAFCLDEPRWDVWTPNASCPVGATVTLDRRLVESGIGNGEVFTAMHGTTPDRTFTIEWRNYNYPFTDVNFDLGLTLHENGDIVVAGHDIDPESPIAATGLEGSLEVQEQEGSPTWGLHCCTFETLHAVGMESGGWPWRSDATQVRIDLPDAGTVSGTITDHATGRPVADAVVEVRRPNGEVQWQLRTDDAGHYTAEIFTDRAYTVAAYKPDAYDRSAPANVRIGAAHANARADLSLTSANPTVTLTADSATQAASVRNPGDQPFEWTAALDVAGVESPESGSLVRASNLHASKAPISIEEDGGSWWVGQADLRHPDNPEHEIREYTTDGDATGTVIAMPDIAARLGLDPRWMLPYDLVYVTATHEVCFVVSGKSKGEYDGVKPFNDIICVDARDGGFTRLIDTGVPDFNIPLGLAYDEAHDRLFLQHEHKDASLNGGDRLGTRLSILAGPGSPEAGSQLNSCTLYGVEGVGMAYQPGSDSLWKLEQAAIRTPIVSQIDPETCTEIGWRRTDHPQTSNTRASDIRPDGTLLSPSLNGSIFEFATGDDDVTSLPWLTLSQTRGTVAPGASAAIEIRVDEEKVPEGVDHVDLVIRGNGGEQSKIRVPIRLRESQQTDTTLALTAAPTKVLVGGKTKVKVRVDTTSGVTPTGEVMVSAPGTKAVKATLVDGAAVVALGPLTNVGKAAVTANYAGDAWNRSSSRSLSLTVAAKPRWRLTSSTVKLKKGKAYVALRCASTLKQCCGRLVLTRNSATLARGRVTLGPGKPDTARLSLTAKGKAILRKGSKVGAVLTMSVTGGPTQKVKVALKPKR